MVGTPRNTERTGKRRVTFLSAIARRVEDVRHCDLDLYQWCPRCKRPQLFAEVKSTLVSRWEWEQTRRHAAYYGHGCLAILVIEIAGSIGLSVYDSADDSISPGDWTQLWHDQEQGEREIIAVLERARDIHECW